MRIGRGATPAVATIDCSRPPEPAIVSRNISAQLAMASTRSSCAWRRASPPSRLGLTNAAMPTSSAAIGQRVNRPMTTAANTPSARRSVRFSTRTRVLGPDRRVGVSAGATGRMATTKVTIPSANSAPSTPATSVTGGPYPFPVLMACAWLTTTATVAVRWTAVSIGMGAPPLTV